MPNPTTTRTWLLATLDEVGRRQSLATEAGVTAPEIAWTDDQSVAITVSLRPGGMTLTAVPPSGQDQLGPLTMPAGWAAADEGDAG